MLGGWVLLGVVGCCWANPLSIIQSEWAVFGEGANLWHAIVVIRGGRFVECHVACVHFSWVGECVCSVLKRARFLIYIS